MSLLVVFNSENISTETDSLCLSLGFCSDLAMDVETCVGSVGGSSDKGKADELLSKQQREGLMGEELNKQGRTSLRKCPISRRRFLA